MYFLYVLHGVAQVSQAALDERGLNHLPKADTLITRGMMDGPEQRACLMVADGRCRPADLRYVPAEQTWQTSLNGQFWLGFWNDKKPTARTLRRQAVIEGYTVDLGPSGVWAIPLARKFPAGTALPQGLILTAGGLTLREKPEFMDFCQKAERLWRQFMRQMEWIEPDAADDLTTQEEWELAAAALGINYHVGADEINGLGLLDTQTLGQIACKIVDVPALERTLMERLEALKKNSPPTGESLSGSACGKCGGSDGLDSTGRPSASS
jgi:hypothetical protein